MSAAETPSQAVLFAEPARACEWCGGPLAGRTTKRTCGKKCRQTRYRLRCRQEQLEAAAVPGRFAYADPPYPGRAHLYRDQPTYAGEVDTRELVSSLEKGRYMGWALSTAADALESVLPIVRSVMGQNAYVRVCAWVKPIGACGQTHGLHNVWEPLIVVRGRQERPGKRDMLIAQPARGGGDLVGRKPIAFAAWLFSCLGMRPGDELADVFPGTGVVGRAWAELGQRRLAPTERETERRLVEATPGLEPSPRPRGDADQLEAAHT